MTRYVVQDGDNLSRIARAHGLASWHGVYYAEENAAFRRRRPDPDLIVVGDVLFVPGPDAAAAPPEEDFRTPDVAFRDVGDGDPEPPFLDGADSVQALEPDEADEGEGGRREVRVARNRRNTINRRGDGFPWFGA